MGMFINKLGIVALGAVAILSSSCIKEDRDDCPCYLSVGLNDALRVGDSAIFTIASPSGEEKQRFAIDLTQYENTDLIVKVEKGIYNLTLTIGENTVSRVGTTLTYPSGQPIDSLWCWFSGEVDCSKESKRVESQMTREFARVHFKVSSPYKSWSQYPYTFECETGVNGIDFARYQPLRGGWRCELDRPVDSAMDFMFLVPRMMADSRFIINAYRKWPIGGVITGGEGKLIQAIDVQASLNEQNYDWYKEELDDIYVTMNYAEGVMMIAINDWITGMKVKVDM